MNNLHNTMIFDDYLHDTMIFDDYLHDTMIYVFVFTNTIKQ